MLSPRKCRLIGVRPSTLCLVRTTAPTGVLVMCTDTVSTRGAAGAWVAAGGLAAPFAFGPEREAPAVAGPSLGVPSSASSSPITALSASGTALRSSASSSGSSAASPPAAAIGVAATALSAFVLPASAPPPAATSAPASAAGADAAAGALGAAAGAPPVPVAGAVGDGGGDGGVAGGVAAAAGFLGGGTISRSMVGPPAGIADLC